MQRSIVVIAHNLRSCHNVGSLLRTAEGLGAQHVYLTGYTPYPLSRHDQRLPHIAAKTDQQIQKTALGAQQSVSWSQYDDVFKCIEMLKNTGHTVAALEQTEQSINIANWTCPSKLALVVGRETEGVEPEILLACDYALEIPMQGSKESFNVVQAAAMALFHCRFYNPS